MATDEQISQFMTNLGKHQAMQAKAHKLSAVTKLDYTPYTSQKYNESIAASVHQVRDTSGVMHRAYPVPEAEVTPEMRDQGMAELAGLIGVNEGNGGLPAMRETVEAICAIALSLAPVPLVSEGELARFGMDPIKVVPRVELDEAVRERDEAISRPVVDDPRWDVVPRTQYVELQGEMMELRDKLMLALTQLAAFTSANVAPEPPKPIHDFTRVWERDRRRVGR